MTDEPEFPVTINQTDAHWLKGQVQQEVDTAYKRGRSRGITIGMVIAASLVALSAILRSAGVL